MPSQGERFCVPVHACMALSWDLPWDTPRHTKGEPGRMTHFLGTHQSRLDAKGRISVPAPFRAALRGGSDTATMILRPSHQLACIEAWPIAVFDALAAPLQQFDVFSDNQNDLATTLYADATPLDADKEGRIVLPEKLLRHAGITDVLEFMGVGRIFQIWHPEAAERRRAEARERVRSNNLTLPGNSGAGNSGAGSSESASR